MSGCDPRLSRARLALREALCQRCAHDGGGRGVSGFAAVFRFDGAPADTAALAAMTQAIAYRGPDGISQWAEGSVAITHLTLHTTAESLEGTQPLVNEDGSLVLGMDGWLANYEELRGDLLARGAVLRTRSDAELVLRAYETWGDDCPKHIDGEYAFVIWDARKREVFCAKDHAGMRPLHYHWDGKRLLVASDLAGVLGAGDFAQAPNLGMIAEHLANEWYSMDETLWAGVMRLPPAHYLRAGPLGPRLRRHWMPPLEVSIRYPREEDYQAHYRELLGDCVRRASRSHRPIACEVSGGHDSSAVFAIAQRLLEQGRLLAPGMTGYTYNFGEEADPAVDEITLARAVGEHLGVEIREIAPFMPDLEWFAERGRADRDMATYPNSAMAVGIGRALTAAGSVVALNGEGGDEFLTAEPFRYEELLAERDWRSLALTLREDGAAFGWKTTLRNVGRSGLRRLVPARLRALRRKWGPGSMGRTLLTPPLLALLEQRRLDSERSVAAKVRHPARRSLFMTLEYGFASYAHEFLARNSARLGYDSRSPLCARKFIEFAFAMPHRQRRRGDIQKHIHIKALGDDLPSVVTNRRTKAVFNLPFLRQLDNARPTVISPMLHCGIEWLDAEALRAFYVYCDGLPMASKPIYSPWAVFGCLTLFR